MAILLNHIRRWLSLLWASTLGKLGLALALILLLFSPALAQLPRAIQNALGLNSQMNVYYADTLSKYLKQFRSQHPIILGLFSTTGGDFYLYKPGLAQPIKAESVPVQYQVLKGVSHSSMALYAILQPYMDGLSSDTKWKEQFSHYRGEMASTLVDVKGMGLQPEVAVIVSKVLQSNISFIDRMLIAGSIDKERVVPWAREISPNFEILISAAADYQVRHWMNVMSLWKKELGSQWEQTYAATNSLYVTRRNNILFTVMAQFFEPEAINDRLMLFETKEFTTTPDSMLSLISRIVKDRDLGQAFFNSYFLMDVELLGTGARDALTRFDKANGITPMLPPLAPFESHEWPWITSSANGRGPTTLQQALRGTS